MARRAAAVAVALTMMATGCTSSGSGGAHRTTSTTPPRHLSTAIPTLPASPPTTPAALAAFLRAGSDRLGSARVHFATALSGSSLSGDGVAQFAGGHVQAMDVRAAVSGVGNVHVVFTGATAYAQLPGASSSQYVVLGSASGNAADRSAIAVQAIRLLAGPDTYRTLVAAAKQVTLRGRAQVGAVPTLTYAAHVRIADLPSGDPVAVALGALGVRTLDLELSIDGAGRTRRATAPTPDGRTSEVQFTDVNQPVDVRAPPPSEVKR